MKKWIVILLLLICLGPVVAYGAENNGVYLSPPFLDVSLKKSDSEFQYVLEIGNNSNKTITMELSVVDFGSLDDSGGVAFLTTKNDNDQKKYALASWLSLEKSEVTVESKSKQPVKVTILNKDSLSPGGHYGAVLATLKAEANNKGDMVGISQSLASLLYIQKNGGEKISLILKNVEWKNDGFFLIDKIKLRFENNGNVHVVPRGKIEVRNWWGEMVGKGIINGDSVKVLPESFRKVEVAINPLFKWRWPGKYSIEINFRFDGKDDFIKYKTSFVYIGFEGIILFSLLVVFKVVIIWKKLKK